MYFNIGALPWQGLKAGNKRQKYEKICEKKLSTSIDELCRGYPPEFATYINTCRNYKFDEEPNYDHLKALLKSYSDKHFSYDFVFDWNMMRFGGSNRDQYTSSGRELPVEPNTPHEQHNNNHHNNNVTNNHDHNHSMTRHSTLSNFYSPQS